MFLLQVPPLPLKKEDISKKGAWRQQGSTIWGSNWILFITNTYYQKSLVEERAVFKGIMVGLGETDEDVREIMRDRRKPSIEVVDNVLFFVSNRPQ